MEKGSGGSALSRHGFVVLDDPPSVPLQAGYHDEGASARQIALRSIGVFVVENHECTLWGLQRLIESAAPRMRFLGAAKSVEEMLARVPAAAPDLLLMDLHPGSERALEALAALPGLANPQVLVLTASRDEAFRERAMKSGAWGVVCKDEPAQTILQAIEEVHAGKTWARAGACGRGTQTPAAGGPLAAGGPESARIASLTPRERDIVAAVVRDREAKGFAIAAKLAMSEHTLRNHLTSIYSKLGVHGRLGLFIYATEHALLHA